MTSTPALQIKCDIITRTWTDQGWGLLSQFSPFRYIPIVSELSKHTLDFKCHVYIWQVSPQLSCGDTCQIWMWFKEANIYFCKIENFAYGEINERSFSNPHPKWGMISMGENRLSVVMYGLIMSCKKYSNVCAFVTNRLCADARVIFVFISLLDSQLMNWTPK